MSLHMVGLSFKACRSLTNTSASTERHARLVADDGVLRALDGRYRRSPAYCYQDVPGLQACTALPHGHISIYFKRQQASMLIATNPASKNLLILPWKILGKRHIQQQHNLASPA